MGSRWLLLAAGALATAGCGDGGDDHIARDSGSRDDARPPIGDADGAGFNPPDGPFGLAPSTVHTYRVDPELDRLGPERGFYGYVEIASATDLSDVRADGFTLAYSYVHLDPFRDAPIGQALLDRVERGLDAARRAGIKIILRFAYNEGPWPNSEPDAPLDRILAHIAQVEPLLRANADVIAIVQAGFIGAWGEWHTSTHGLHEDPAAQRQIVEALLDAIPADRAVQLRNPQAKERMHGAPRTDEGAFDGSDAARTGHHNDCFLASETDLGTYPEDDPDTAIDETEQWMSYVAADTRYVPMGGETCGVFPERSACTPAMAEMERMHFSYLNAGFHEDVIESWHDDDCYEDIARQLGYRLAVTEAHFAERARPGGAFTFRARIENSGWAGPFNPRPLHLRLLRDGEAHDAVVEGVDVRRWLGGGAHDVSVTVDLPSDLEAGEYELALALPDPAASLQARAEYAMPFVNDEWDAARSALVLGRIAIAADAPGDSRPGVGTLSAR